MTFNENTRVKIPAILHLIRLGFSYISLANESWQVETNIFTNIFKKSVQKINPSAKPEEIERLLEEIALTLDNEDIGKTFYEKLTNKSGLKLIEYSDFSKNSFHVVTELPCKNEDEEFRPDITILINGMPLAFIEVKKPHNKEGIIDERNRMNRRFKNKYFRRFANITQLMVFSNNMEYEDGVVDPVFGAFYTTIALVANNCGYRMMCFLWLRLPSLSSSMYAMAYCNMN